MQSLINKHLNILCVDEKVKKVFTPSQVVTFRSARKFKNSNSLKLMNSKTHEIKKHSNGFNEQFVEKRYKERIIQKN